MEDRMQAMTRKMWADVLPARITGTYKDLYGNTKTVNGIVTSRSSRDLGVSYAGTKKYGRQVVIGHSCEVLMVDGEVLVGHFDEARVHAL